LAIQWHLHIRQRPAHAEMHSFTARRFLSAKLSSLGGYFIGEWTWPLDSNIRQINTR
jgi:hypothetical protein